MLQTARPRTCFCSAASPSSSVAPSLIGIIDDNLVSAWRTQPARTMASMAHKLSARAGATCQVWVEHVTLVYRGKHGHNADVQYVREAVYAHVAHEGGGVGDCKRWLDWLKI